MGHRSGSEALREGQVKKTGRTDILLDFSGERPQKEKPARREETLSKTLYND